MALLGRPGGNLRPQYAQRVYTANVAGGQTRIQSWPRKKPKRPSTYEASIRANFSNAQAHIKRLGTRETDPLRQGLNTFLARNRGQRGSAAIRFRDLMTQLVTGRLWAIEFPDGRVSYSESVAQDISDALDWIDPTVGSLVTNVQGQWLGSAPCLPGARMTATPDGGLPGCCGPAQRWYPPADAE